ncbi:MAG: aminopeptidase P N-terminal domain-containing protein [Sulfurimonadaceae bacterium]|nr:aminopeptidase P N-terminal domain-containing protein [Sulfurimonadaceae bacterium]
MNEATYSKRRKKLISKMKEGVGVVASARWQTRSNDTEFPYRQSSDFYYLSGFKEDNAALVFVKRPEGAKTVLFVQPKNEEMELWTGVRLGVEAASKQFDVDEVHSIDDYESVMKELLKGHERLYLELFDEDSVYTRTKALCKTLLHDRSCKQSPRTFIDVTQIIRSMRLIKDKSEIGLIKKALKITEAAHHRAMQMARPGMKEYEIQAEFEYAFKKAGAYSDAYTTIVAGGNNANTLHYITNQDTLRAKELLLIDAGSEYEMYASDITRTFPVDGKFTKAQRELYEMVLDVQLRVIDAIKPGITKTYLQERSELWLTEGMVALGILKGKPKKLVETKAHRKYFPHGIGHWMGLDVHDPCPYADERGNDVVFKAGMVLTIEPGIYINEDDKSVAKRYRGIGIRIEDNILVTRRGCENLSQGIAKTVEEIEALCLAGL